MTIIRLVCITMCIHAMRVRHSFDVRLPIIVDTNVTMIDSVRFDLVSQNSLHIKISHLAEQNVRKMCKYCRFEKCINVDMRRDGNCSSFSLQEINHSYRREMSIDSAIKRSSTCTMPNSRNVKHDRHTIACSLLQTTRRVDNFG